MAVFGLLLIVAGISFLTHEGLTNDGGPGAVTANVTEIREAGGRYIVMFTVRNGGHQTLSQLNLTARLTDEGTEIESARATVDFLPGGSITEGGFYLQNDPRRHALEIRPEGYMTP